VTDGWTAPSGGTPGEGAPPPADPGAGWSTQPPRPAWGDYPVPPTAPRPGVVPLRPLAVGELLDGAFTTIRRYAGATLGLAALVMLVVTAIQVAASYYLLHGIDNVSTSGEVSSDFLSRTVTVDLVVGVAGFFATLVLSGAITAVVGQAVLGRPMGPGQAWRVTRPRLAPLLGLSLLLLVGAVAIIGVAALPGILVAVAGATAAGIALVTAGVLLGLVVVVWLFVTLELATPAVVLEKQGVVAAMRRSRVLVRGSWWRVFGIVLLALVLAQIVSGIIALPFSVAAGFSSLLHPGEGHPLDFSTLLLTGIGGLLAGTIARPFSAGVVALLYIDRRMRAEALDLTLQQAAADDGR
jgi:hypothetical protein